VAINSQFPRQRRCGVRRRVSCCSKSVTSTQHCLPLAIEIPLPSSLVSCRLRHQRWLLPYRLLLLVNLRLNLTLSTGRSLTTPAVDSRGPWTKLVFSSKWSLPFPSFSGARSPRSKPWCRASIWWGVSTVVISLTVLRWRDSCCHLPLHGDYTYKYVA
jgi:hypothetical protein